jgi:glycosyltransferase involved in cell wall biosynthesis
VTGVQTCALPIYLLKIIPNLKYIIIGSGENHYKIIKYLQKENLTKTISLMGFRDDVLRIVKSSSLFVFPSKQEGLPVSLMEAMALKVPILCSEIRGNIDLIKDNFNGYLFDLNDKESFQKKLFSLYINYESLSKQFITNSALFIDSYSIKNVNLIMENEYKNLLK